MALLQRSGNYSNTSRRGAQISASGLSGGVQEKRFLSLIY